LENSKDLSRFISLIDVNNFETLERELKKQPKNVHLATENGWNMLMMSVSHGVNECVQVLIEAGIDLDQTNTFGKTALIVAATYGNCEAAEMLLQKGAKLRLRDKTGVSAFEIAMQPDSNRNCDEIFKIFAPYHNQFDAKDLALYKENRFSVLYA
jgi:ankyrin repeat protein